MLASTLANNIRQGALNDKFQEVYIDPQVAQAQIERYATALDNFIKEFGDQEVSIFSAPGRSEISGNHTDHQHGKVLACAVNLDIIAVVAKAQNTVTIVSDEYRLNPVDITSLGKKEEEAGTSESLIRGVAARLKELDYHIGGFVAYTHSTVLQGSGLSSSAAFEVLLGTIFSGLYNDMRIDPVLIAQIGQFAENVYFDKPCGLMDQCASSVGSLIFIDFKDKAHPKVEKIEIDFEAFDHSLCIVDVHASHADLTPDYAAIPFEMKGVAKCFDKEVLREVDEEDFLKQLPLVREKVSDRALLRAIHLFEENKRVDRIVKALKNKDFSEFKQVIEESGRSSFNYLQNIYSNHDVDNQAVSLALALSDISLQKTHGVSRVHGGGFAGTIQAFVRNDDVKNYQDVMEHTFGKGSCHILKIRKFGGLQIV